MSNIETSVRTIIHEMGVPAHLPGYHYLIEAICIAVNNPDVMDAIDEVLYPQVAKIFQTKPPRVDRQIRYAIEIACDRGIWKLCSVSLVLPLLTPKANFPIPNSLLALLNT